MKSPLERAARALCALDGHAPDVKLDGKPLWQDYLPEVRTVIASIKEPSSAMVAAADGLSCSVGTIAQWQAMIDEALEEATGGTAPNYASATQA